MSISDFVEQVEIYDMVYLLDIDTIFFEEYWNAFSNPEDISNHRLYYATVLDGKILLEDVD